MFFYFLYKIMNREQKIKYLCKEKKWDINNLKPKQILYILKKLKDKNI